MMPVIFHSETTSQATEQSGVQLSKPDASGFADAAEGLKVHYEVYGKGEPIVVMAGCLMGIREAQMRVGPSAISIPA